MTNDQTWLTRHISADINSFYRWKGKIENEDECVLIAKTTDENVEKTVERIKQIHSYELPDIIVIPVIGGLKEYLEYVTNETSWKLSHYYQVVLTPQLQHI